MTRPTTINLGKEMDSTQLLKAKARRTRYLKTVIKCAAHKVISVVDARNNLILLLFAKAETKGPNI